VLKTLLNSHNLNGFVPLTYLKSGDHDRFRPMNRGLSYFGGIAVFGK
jgi:hypothetical protein